MHLRQTSDASAAVVASAVSTSSFSSCFSLRFFCALLLKFLPAVSHRRSHTLLSPLSTPLFLLLSLVLCPPSDLSLSLSLPSHLSATHLHHRRDHLANVIVSCACLCRLASSLSLLLLSSTFSLLTLSFSSSLSLLPFATISQRSPGQRLLFASWRCLCCFAAFSPSLSAPSLPSLLCSFSLLSLSLSSSAVAIYLIACLLRCGCCASPRDQP